MKYIIMKGFFAILFISFSVAAFSQDPVRWTYKAVKAGNKKYTVQLSAIIQPGWHLYSQQQPADAIALPTDITFLKNPLIQLKGNIREKGAMQKYKDETLGVEAYQYSGEVDFVQDVQLKAGVKTNLSGTVTYQVCTDEKCLPPKTTTFSIQLE